MVNWTLRLQLIHTISTNRTEIAVILVYQRINIILATMNGAIKNNKLWKGKRGVTSQHKPYNIGLKLAVNGRIHGRDDGLSNLDRSGIKLLFLQRSTGGKSNLNKFHWGTSGIKTETVNLTGDGISQHHPTRNAEKRIKVDSVALKDDLVNNSKQQTR